MASRVCVGLARDSIESVPFSAEQISWMSFRSSRFNELINFSPGGDKDILSYHKAFAIRFFFVLGSLDYFGRTKGTTE